RLRPRRGSAWPASTVPPAVIVAGFRTRNNAVPTAAVTTSTTAMIRPGHLYHARRAAIGDEGGGPGWSGADPAICDMMTIPLEDYQDHGGKSRPTLTWVLPGHQHAGQPLPRH